MNYRLEETMEDGKINLVGHVVTESIPRVGEWITVIDDKRLSGVYEVRNIAYVVNKWDELPGSSNMHTSEVVVSVRKP